MDDFLARVMAEREREQREELARLETARRKSSSRRGAPPPKVRPSVLDEYRLQRAQEEIARRSAAATIQPAGESRSTPIRAPRRRTAAQVAAEKRRNLKRRQARAVKRGERRRQAAASALERRGLGTLLTPE